MTEAGREQAIQDHVEWCREQRANAEETLACIAKGWTFHEAHGNEQMQDVTAKRAAKQKEIIGRMERILAAYGNRDT